MYSTSTNKDILTLSVSVVSVHSKYNPQNDQKFWRYMSRVWVLIGRDSCSVSQTHFVYNNNYRHENICDSIKSD